MEPRGKQNGTSYELRGKTAFITGCSRGIGRAIALRLAKEGVNIAVVAKTADPNPKLSGTIHSVAKEIEALGAQALPVQCDIRFEEQVQAALAKTFERFGAIHIVVNNASAISLTDTEATTMKKYDLMQSVNARGTFLVSKCALQYLKRNASNGIGSHILNLSPPLLMDSKWFQAHTAYTMSKYGMSMCVLGMSKELAKYSVAVNALWPRTIIATEALNAIAPNKSDAEQMARCGRTPAIVADAACVVLRKNPAQFSGNFCIDDEILAREVGIKDFTAYAIDPTRQLASDLFVANAKL